MRPGGHHFKKNSENLKGPKSLKKKNSTASLSLFHTLDSFQLFKGFLSFIFLSLFLCPRAGLGSCLDAWFQYGHFTLVCQNQQSSILCFNPGPVWILLIQWAREHLRWVLSITGWLRGRVQPWCGEGWEVPDGDAGASLCQTVEKYSTAQGHNPDMYHSHSKIWV